MPTDTSVSEITTFRETKSKLSTILTERKFIGMFDKYYVFYSRYANNDIYTAFDVGKDFNCTPVVKLELDKISGNRYEVDFVYVHQKYRGKDLAAKFYSYLVTEHDFVILSGSSQSKGGRSIWISLSRSKKVDIFISNRDGKRKTQARFINGKYPSTVEISDVQFIAMKPASVLMVPYR
jgi:GNAT superfamily N-acetyltransferase